MNAGAHSWQPARTHLLVVGITAWPARADLPPAVGPRRDTDLVKQFKAAGVPSRHIVFLKDRAATRAGMRKALRVLAACGAPGDTLIFCFLGHGGREVLYGYDYDDRRSKKTVFQMKEICGVLEKSWKGDRLILIGDFCGSGSLAVVLRNFQKRRPELQVAILASAMESSDSTSQWTFTEGVIRILAGDPLADRDHDGRITMADAGRFLHDQMKYKANQLASVVLSVDFGDDFEIRTVAAGMVIRKLPGPYQIGDIVEARDKQGHWAAAEVAEGKRVRGVGKYRFRESEEWLDAASLRPIAKKKLRVGQRYEVIWQGKWYPAIVTKSLEDHFYFVHYENDTGEHDEWIPYERSRKPPLPLIPMKAKSAKENSTKPTLKVRDFKPKANRTGGMPSKVFGAEVKV